MKTRYRLRYGSWNEHAFFGNPDKPCYVIQKKVLFGWRDTSEKFLAYLPYCFPSVAEREANERLAELNGGST